MNALNSKAHNSGIVGTIWKHFSTNFCSAYADGLSVGKEVRKLSFFNLKYAGLPRLLFVTSISVLISSTSDSLET
jgi:hypothetical protein